MSPSHKDGQLVPQSDTSRSVNDGHPSTEGESRTIQYQLQADAIHLVTQYQGQHDINHEAPYHTHQPPEPSLHEVRTPLHTHHYEVTYAHHPHMSYHYHSYRERE
jgi:hypothetical protein